jgi:hypothetical protein
VKEQLVYCGVDIAKWHLDAAIGKEKRRLPNDATGHRQFIKWIKQIEAQVQVIMEGKGACNRSSSVQAVGSLPAVALMERAGRAVALPSFPEMVVIADYGRPVNPEVFRAR